jgi:diaminopimelate epimerase
MAKTDARSIPFTKMQGLGNDFVVIVEEGCRAFPASEAATPIGLTPKLARAICDRRFGIGADQILWLRNPSAAGDVRMEILNPDGSTAEMCGNGIRAVAIFLRDHGARKAPSYDVETLAGLLKVSLDGDLVMVNMGQPQLGQGTLSREGESLVGLSASPAPGVFFEVGMGNPHAVFFFEGSEAEFAAYPVERLGPVIETHARFPKRTNVEFVRVIPDAKDGPTIQVRVWERGTGITLACGTGACASAVATLATGRAKGRLNVDLPGGRLRIGWEGEGQPVMMEGPAREVFSGRYSIAD